MMEGKLFKQ